MAGGRRQNRSGRSIDLIAALSVLAAAAVVTTAFRERGDDGRRRAALRPSADDDAVIEDHDPHGRAAVDPLDIPPRGWREIGFRLYSEFVEDRVLAVAAGVTFYALLSLFPALVALVSLYGLTSDLATLGDHLQSFDGVVPHGALDFIGDQVSRIVEKSDGALGFAFVFGLATALWSANSGVKAMFDALNVVYDEREKRNFLILNLTSLAFTLGTVAFLLFAFNAVVVLPIVLGFIWLGSAAETLLTLARWPALLVCVLAGLTLLYRFGPSRRSPKWRWATTGSLVAGVVWIAGSFAFSWYAENLGHFDKTYGSLGAAIGFMLWMWMSVIVVLLGGELNAEMERQTAVDTTTGRPKPMGMRGATVADQVAGQPPAPANRGR